MKKIVVAIVVVVLLLVAAPWGIGKLAEQRVDRGLDQVGEVAPYLRIVERKYTPGWFRSEQEVTFEVVGPWTGAFGKSAAVAQAMEQAAAPAPIPGDAAAESTPPEPPPTVTPPPDIEPVRFTVRNEILHGPVLWTSGFGLARVNSRIVVSDKVRQSLIDTFGTDEPLRIATKFGFFGGRRTTLTADAHKVALKNNGGEISWDDLRVDVSYASDLGSFDIEGDWPRIAFRDAAGTSSFLAEDMTIDGESERISGDLYDGDVEMRIGKVRIQQTSGAFDARDVYYLADSSLDGDFMSMKFGFGTGEVSGSSVSLFGSPVKEMHYDFAVRRLHTKTLARFMTALKESYTKPPMDGVSAEIAAFEPIKAQTFELFKHDPELVIERVGLTTTEGEAYFKGVVRFKGVTEQDLAIGGLGLIGKLDATIEFSGHRKVVEKLPGGAGSVGELIDGGYVERSGDKLVSKIEFRAGALTINGKPQGIPGLGPTPGAMDPEAVPPQE